MIILKWHEIHDNGLYSVQILSSVIHGQSVLPVFRTVQDHTHREAPFWKDKSETLGFNLILIFPRKSGFSGLGLGLHPAPAAMRPSVQTQRTHPNLTVTRNRKRISEYTNCVPQHKGMTFEQLEAGWIYILLQKKKKKGGGKYIHEGKMGWTTIIWNQVSTIFTYSYQLHLNQQGSCQLSHTCLQYEQDCGSRKHFQSWGPNGNSKMSYTV